MNQYYDYYFEHGGLCPTCRHLLTMHYGCDNPKCEDCIEHTKKDPIFSKRIEGYVRKMKREKERYNNLVKRINERKNIDKCQEKKYADFKHS